ncbi:TolC family protein [Vibrio aquimaris]|uniref:Outer membrane protein TolC n=1 Tax=Vibrio aquimaris TaxID=2587862 RepID=A0A5P9CLN2_9VIBR|nr:TolC family protein [Vibrio aquimaris]QFT26647.1 Outer membrane protein TolC precursor [Vibrio aquimaris]
MASQRLFSITSLFLAITSSASCFSLTIDQAWQLAKKHDPDYEMAQIDLQIGETDVSVNRSALLPSLDAKASSNWNQDSDNTNSYNVGLSQTIWDSSLWSNLDQAQANYLKTELELAKARDDLAQKVLAAYLNVASAQSQLLLAEKKFAEGHKLLKIIEKRYRAGRVTSVDVEEIKATQIAEKSSILEAKANLNSQMAQLAALVNQTPEHVEQIKTDSLVEPKMLVKSESQWLKLSMDKSPELLAAVQSVKSSEFARQSARGGYYPTVSGNLGYSDDDTNSDGEFNAGLTLNLPIDLNGSTKAKVEAASLNVLKAKQYKRKIEIDIEKRIRQQYNQVSIDWERVLMASSLVDSNARVLKSKQTLYDAGKSEASDVIDAHNRLYEAKVGLETNLYNYWQERIDLLHTSGQLDDGTILTISQAFH